MKNSKKSKDFNKIIVSTFNVRTLSSDAHLIELENALLQIKYDIIGLCEVKRTGQVTFEQNGNIYHFIGNNNVRGSVGFVVKTKWKEKNYPIQRLFRSCNCATTTSEPEGKFVNYSILCSDICCN